MRGKKIKIVVLSLCLIGAIFSMPLKTAEAANSLFIDVPDDSKYFQALFYLKNSGAVKGYSDMTFKPNNTITRAEFLKMIMTHAGIKNMLPKTELFKDMPTFTDVKNSDWYRDSINHAYVLGIAKGYSDNTFKPMQAVQLAEGLKMLFIAHDTNVPTINIKESPFLDVRASSWLLPYAKFAWEKNMILMQNDGKLHGETNVTRGEAAELIYRLSVIANKQFAPFDLSSEWPTYSNNLLGLSVKTPFDWQVIPEGTRIVLWLQDKANKQTDYEYISPSSAKIVIRPMVLSGDDLKIDSYFESVKQFTKRVFPNDEIKFQQITVGENTALHFTIPTKNIYNWYIVIKGQPKAFVVYTQIGSGNALKQFETVVNLVIPTIKYTPSGLSADQQTEIDSLLSRANAAVNVEKGATEVIRLIGDTSIIETDEIGVGIGPVDYYFSKKVNITIKVERTSNTVLGVRGGKNTKF
ncbi:MAG: oligopeptide ABC transporter substrate binding protein [Candidatus Peregrinibacteria bacterium GW2011_GWC2_39_14]|nr:MAG: Cellulosome-anchoring protein [Candidatus Peregrinibacteria bacterium GW2011_GWA2_38_36]KKR06617.1 MAG: oligopeptide ABC transporter substrate binding protein [Candidatus Peregrinibacteria bacterium GW2011_GWC2_39_14]